MRQELIYNGSYSSELNPVELIFALSKRIFSKEIINVTNFKDTDAMMKLVGRCLDAVNPLSLELHVNKCV